ncbi:MAG: phosphodiesterase [Dictyoglomaceae bacterium]|nr:phosphodiesterase [Dictyoglomaceae bacterium]HPP15518.1 phosphodiesterase [Dictyoglomaceae bacterium]
MIFLKILVMSDTHGDVSFWEMIKGKIEESNLVIHAGDVLYHGPRNPLPAGYNPQKLSELINNSGLSFFISKGNCDADVDQLMLRYPIMSPYVFLYLPPWKILVTHGEEKSEDELWDLMDKFGVDLLVFGHIHIPVLKKKEDKILLNPGSPSLSKISQKTIALIEDNKVIIWDINNNKELDSISL